MGIYSEHLPISLKELPTMDIFPNAYKACVGGKILGRIVEGHVRGKREPLPYLLKVCITNQ